jgi:transcriptional regulator with XRE-family HTH domain
MTNQSSDLVAARIQALRQSRGWSARDLARRCAELGANQLTASVIANIETGRRDASGRRRRDVSVDELLTLALALEVPPLDLIQISAADKPMNVQITPLVSASRDELISWLRGRSAFIPLNPLDGFALCGSCRTPLSIRGGPDEPRFYCANPSCDSPVIDCAAGLALRRVLEMLADLGRTEDFRKAVSALHSDESAESTESQIVALQTEIDNLEDQRANAIRDLENLAEHPELSTKVVAGAISSFDGRINDLRQEIAKARRRLHSKNSIRIEIDDTVGSLPRRPRRAMMAALMTVIITPNCNIEIERLWEQKQ